MSVEYRIIEPEVAGGFGERTALDYSTNPWTVRSLHYEFQGWLGDDLLTTHPCFIVTFSLKESLVKFNGTGYSFDDVIATKSAFFDETYPEVVLPSFSWLKIHGQPGHDDAGLGKNSQLVVSNNFLDVLKQHAIENCIIRRKPFVHSVEI